MSNRVEFAGRDERIDRVLRRLIDGVREERGLERITVVTPTNQASFYIRRALAKGGLFNVDFKRLEDVAEQLAGRDFKEPLLHDLQASEFVFESARDVTLGKQLGGAEVSPQLQSALHSTFRELELLEQHQLEQIAGQSEVQRELVARFNKYMELASGYRRGSKVAAKAAEHIHGGDHPTSRRGLEQAGIGDREFARVGLRHHGAGEGMLRTPFHRGGESEQLLVSGLLG